MRNELRIIKSTFMAGLTDVLTGLVMFFTGWHEWYFEHFHVFGILGLGMLYYAAWHWYFYVKDRGDFFWNLKLLKS